MPSRSLTCGRCGKPLDVLRGFCPHCGAMLVSLRCGRCGYRGAWEDFPGGACPRCLAEPARLRWSLGLALFLLGLLVFLSLVFFF